MTRLLFTTVLLTMLTSANMRHAQAAPPATNPATRPAAANGWDPSFFAYERPNPIEVEVTTPTGPQVAWVGRPPQMPKEAAALVATKEKVKPRTVGPVDIVRLMFRDADGDVVPALLSTPNGEAGPFRLVVAVHGLTSNKAQVTAQLAPQLAQRGFAVLAIDLPRHGERPGDPRSLLQANNPLQTFNLFRQAIRDVRMGIDVAEQRPELDLSNGVVLMGYSLGSWINAVAGTADERVTAMVLMVGGAHDVPLAAVPLPGLRAADPRTAIAHFAPRPLLLLNARKDPIVTPEMGKRLFAACDGTSSEQRWYDCGHLLVDKAYADAAEWVERVSAERAAKRKKAG